MPATARRYTISTQKRLLIKATFGKKTKISKQYVKRVTVDVTIMIPKALSRFTEQAEVR